MSPSFTTKIHFLTLIAGAAALGLSPLSFGISCIWVNSVASFLTLLYHFILLLLIRRQYMRRLMSSKKTLPTEKRSQFDYSDEKVLDISMPSYPSPSYSPPPYEIQIFPNRPSSKIASAQSQHCQFSPPPWTASNTDVESNTKTLNINKLSSNPFYSFLSLLSNILIMVFTTVAFGMTLEVTLNGSKSILPAERAKGMTLPWNIKSQKAICTVLATLTLMMLITLVLCVQGRSKIASIERDKREEDELYGVVSEEDRVPVHWPGA